MERALFLKDFLCALSVLCVERFWFAEDKSIERCP
jgi:hypothetical protein